jgi:Domain of Unknown Function (DUF928)
MLPIKNRFQSIPVSILTVIALGLSGVAQPAWSESVPNQQNIQGTQIIFNDPVPPNQGSPNGRQRGGASRGPCRQFEALTALVPSKNGMVWGKTTSDRPTFWFYLPNQLTAQTPVEFVLQDDADNYVYNTRFTAPETRSGLISLAVPSTVKSLEVGKSYSWTLSVYCDSAKPSNSVFVKGTIQRVSLDAALQNRLQGSTPIEQVNLYAANGIWFEALNTLANLYRLNPGERQLASAWGNLLQQVNLVSLVQVPFAPCCTFEQQTSNR